jgi:hypothetical protein
MKAVFGLGLVLASCVAGSAFAQGQKPAPKAFVASTNAVSSQQASSITLHEPATALRLTEPADTNAFHYTVSKTIGFRVSGPLVQPLKAKSGAELSHRVFHLFSPFAKEQPSWQTAPTGPVNTRAWSTIAGWNPGGSAFPDEKAHEPPHLDLISISIEKRPYNGLESSR